MSNSVEPIGIAFSPEGVEIEFVEVERQTEHVGEVRRLYLDRDHFHRDVATIVELVRDLIDDAYVTMRNPPASVPLDGSDADR